MRWTEAAWLADVTAWIPEQVRVVGEIEQPHVRPWSTVMRVPSPEGDLWFKAVTPLDRFEPALTAFLARLRPDRVPEVVALNPDRAWMLMRDGGRRLRELPATVEHWERLLPGYAELQIAAAPHLTALLDFWRLSPRSPTAPARSRGRMPWHRFVAASQAQDEEDLEAAAYGVRRFLEGGPIGTWE